MSTSACWIEFQSDSLESLEIPHSQIGGALQAVANVIRNITPLFIMCDPSDIRSIPMTRAPFSQRPTIYIYDNYPGGIGLSLKLMNYPYPLFSASLDLVNNCPCQAGCPSCVGPVLEVGEKGKMQARKMLEFLNKYIASA